MAAGVILLASAVQTASGNTGDISGLLPDWSRVTGLVVSLNVSAISVGTSLDVFVQSSEDGTVWDDFIHFTTVVTTTGNWVAKWLRDATPTVPTGPTKDASLGAATVNQGPIGGGIRIKYVIVGTSYTFSVAARPIRSR